MHGTLSVLSALDDAIAWAVSAEKENASWKDTDCNKCPISSWSTDDGGCDDICRSKSKLIQWLADTDYDMNHYKKEAAQARADRDNWKTTAKMYRSACHGQCHSCVRLEREKDIPSCSNCNASGNYVELGSDWVFDEARFAVKEDHDEAD